MIVSQEYANMFVTRKHHLTSETKASTVITVVRDVCGLHAQDPITPYLSLFNRVRHFKKEKLEHELYNTKRLVKIHCMRGTLHIISTAVWEEVYRATKACVKKVFKRFGNTPIDRQCIYDSILKVLSDADGGLTIKELKCYLPELRRPEHLIAYMIVNEMCSLGLLIRGKPRGGWKSALYEYVRFDEWLPGLQPRFLDEFQAKINVVTRYIAAFGPVSKEDITWWTGFTDAEVNSLLKAIQHLVVAFKVPTLNEAFFLLKSDVEDLQQVTPNQTYTVNLLPRFDPYMMGYANRELY